jgi:hypothetical protein
MRPDDHRGILIAGKLAHRDEESPRPVNSGMAMPPISVYIVHLQESKKNDSITICPPTAGERGERHGPQEETRLQ